MLGVVDWGSIADMVQEFTRQITRILRSRGSISMNLISSQTSLSKLTTVLHKMSCPTDETKPKVDTLLDTSTFAPLDPLSLTTITIEFCDRVRFGTM